MHLIEWIENLYAEEPLLCGVTAISAGVLLLSAIFAWCLRDKGIYVALSAILGGGIGALFFSEHVDKKAGLISVSALLIFGGIVYLLLSGLFAWRHAYAERKRRLKDMERQLQFTLPERENTYIRCRLQTSLRYKEGEMTEVDEKYVGKTIRFDHAKELLSKVRSSALTTAERLQTEEIAKTFSVYMHKEHWSAEELRAVNDLFASLLKLSAKYVV